MTEKIRETLLSRPRLIPDKDLIEEAIRRYWENTCVISWNTDDVHAAANGMEMVLTQEAAISILNEVQRTHDCELGITWMNFEALIPDLARQMTIAEVNSEDTGYIIDDALSPSV
jgi:hypothetical protein